jgi:hypothetical protein
MKYTKNTPLAILRLIVMSTFVEKKINPAQKDFLLGVAEKFTLSGNQLNAIVTDHEAKVLEAQKSSEDFYLGNGAFPKDLVRAAFDDIERTDLRLQIAHHIKLLLTINGREHTANEVACVELMVRYWGIKESWHDLVKTYEEEIAKKKGGVVAGGAGGDA